MVVVKEELMVCNKYINLQQNAEKRGIEFTLSLAKLRKLLSTKRCFYTNVEFVMDNAQLNRSIDRIDSSKGYTDDNVVACTVAVNNFKGNLSNEAIYCIASKLRKLERAANKPRSTKRQRRNFHKQTPQS